MLALLTESYNIFMQRWILLTFLCTGLMYTSSAQVEEPQPSDNPPTKKQTPPRSDRDREAGESSSRDSRIDLSPPRSDAKDHPNSASAVADIEPDTPPDDVQEFHPWNPHKAMKDIEVGDFYFKKKNYRAALNRYREALVYKPNDALANFHMGECLEKLKQPEEARIHYEEYLRILPHGPLAPEAEKALQKLKAENNDPSETAKPKN
ncbi:MAG TPA: tetratricopeptide repeat protein [Terriglobales bacterium]|nr:tetratricopeptide repeat protein [Terriglobales bacterium]